MKKQTEKLLETISMWLTFIGGLNWGLVGLGYLLSANLNLVDLLLGRVPFLENLVYIAVGAGAIFLGRKSIKKIFK